MKNLLGMRPMLWPTLFYIPAMIALFMLGSWQVDRMAWKNNLIEQVNAGLNLEPVDLPATITDPAELHYIPARVSGQFHHEMEMHLFAHSRNGNPGYQIFTPLERPDGSFVIVNRGWVPHEIRPPESRKQGQINGDVTISGIARQGWQQAPFVADNVPDANEWFYGDLDQMAQSKGLKNYLPVFLYADETENPGGYPVGGQAKISFRNNHLEYALTWYGMMVVLTVIFVAFHRQVAKEGRQKETAS